MIKRSLSDDYHVMTAIANHSDVMKAVGWCNQNVQSYDPEGGSLYDKRGWAFERFHYGTKFVFLREKDAFMFSLRWE